MVVSHDLEDAFAIADYVYLLAAGRIVAEGTPEQMRASTDANVRQFLGGHVDGPVAFRAAALPWGQAILAAPRDRRLWVAGRVKIDDWGDRRAAEMHLDDAAWA